MTWGIIPVDGDPAEVAEHARMLAAWLDRIDTGRPDAADVPHVVEVPTNSTREGGR